MGNKITTIVTTVIILIVFMMMAAFISTDTQIDESKQIIRSFTEDIQYKGYLTYDQYIDVVNSIPYKNIKIQITHIKRDDYSTYRPGTLDMSFTTQIMGGANDKGYKIHTNDGDIYSGTLLCTSGDKDNQGIYKFEVGDQVQVDLVVMESTFFDAVVGTLTGKGSPAVKILTSESGVILNTKY